MAAGKRNKRKGRVQILKRLLIVCLLTAIPIPIAVCIYLGIRVGVLKARVEELQSETARLRSEAQRMEASLQEVQAKAERNQVRTEEDSIRIWEQQSQETAPARAPQSEIRKVYLTFDDGPSIYTDDILDILKEYDVKATFFVVGKGKEPYEESLRRIVKEGHTLAMHSYSHVYEEIYASKEAFIWDVNTLQDYLYEVTGVHPDIYRFPGGSSNHTSQVEMQELKGYLDEIGITWYDWNISGGDATGHLDKERIIRNCTANLENYGEAVILLHDAADKKTTVEALRGIIETILEMEDTVIVPITKDTLPIQHGT